MREKPARGGRRGEAVKLAERRPELVERVPSLLQRAAEFWGWHGARFRGYKGICMAETHVLRFRGCFALDRYGVLGLA